MFGVIVIALVASGVEIGLSTFGEGRECRQSLSGKAGAAGTVTIKAGAVGTVTLVVSLVVHVKL